jgi:PDZ domain
MTSRHSLFTQALIVLLSAIPLHAAPATQPATQPTTNASIANATTNPTNANQIANWFADLANRDASRRDAARQNLMGLSRDDLPTLESLVKTLAKKNHALAPSQAAALRDIVTQVFLSGESFTALPGNTGFLGVSFPGYAPGDPADIDDGTPQTGIVVINRIPGFPGYRYLQNGDIIMGATEMGDESINRAQDLSGFISSYHDGDTVHLKILRAGQMLTVPVQLSAHPDLGDPKEDILQLPKVRHRQDLADQYWDDHFAAYLQESMS